jgi:hypothetical protein
VNNLGKCRKSNIQYVLILAERIKKATYRWEKIKNYLAIIHFACGCIKIKLAGFSDKL